MQHSSEGSKVCDHLYLASVELLLSQDRSHPTFSSLYATFDHLHHFTVPFLLFQPFLPLLLEASIHPEITFRRLFHLPQRCCCGWKSTLIVPTLLAATYGFVLACLSAYLPLLYIHPNTYSKLHLTVAHFCLLETGHSFVIGQTVFIFQPLKAFSEMRLL